MKRWLVVLLVLFIMPAFLFTVSCQKKVASQANKPVATVVLAKPAAPAAPTFSGAPEFINEKIYFDFDKAQLDKKAWDILTKKAEWLKANPTAKLTIEGNCDERGTNEYNIALGWRRAENAKRYLIDVSGIKPERINSISYGEEKPVCKEKTEECWAKNRNDSFVVLK